MPAALVTKVVVTHRGAARAKYGAAGWTKIRHAVTQLTHADAARGIVTRFVALDSASDAHKLGVAAVTAPADAASIKATVDAIDAKWQPAYLVLLGGPDLLAPVELTNPLWTGNAADDPDQVIPSDLPYACDAPYSTSPADYRAPSRVVGRIPDLIGVADPSVLVDQLARAARGQSLLRSTPEPAFALSARVWQRSTAMTVAALPELSGDVRTSPADGPAWLNTDLAPAVHLVNCHGAEFDPHWYGQASPNNWNLPIAVSAADLGALVRPGAVVAAECCYGTAHWPPSSAGGQASVAMTYLQHGAAGVFGSSTVAYGPAASNAYADVLCRLFLSTVLTGASLGRSVLVARQQYVGGRSFLDPTDLKTLAQFTLLGDPAAVPFTTSAPASGTSTWGAAAGAAPKSFARRTITAAPASGAVSLRRAQLASVGAALARSTFATSDRPQTRRGMRTHELAELVGRRVPDETMIRTFRTHPAAGQAARSAEMAPRAHVAYLQRRGTHPPSLVVVRDVGGEPDVHVLERR